MSAETVAQYLEDRAEGYARAATASHNAGLLEAAAFNRTISDELGEVADAIKSGEWEQ